MRIYQGLVDIAEINKGKQYLQIIHKDITLNFTEIYQIILCQLSYNIL